jgi:glutamate-1-semialdehyde 2,1-aminomutase
MFEDDPGRVKGFAFCTAAVAQGVYFHPTHNMFLSAAHTEQDIEHALEAAGYGFRAVQRLHALAAE